MTIITCEKCDTGFKVPEGHIKPDGTKVRCSSCKHVWLVRLPEKEEEANTAPAEQTPKADKEKSEASKKADGDEEKIDKQSPVDRAKTLLAEVKTLISSKLSTLSNHKLLEKFKRPAKEKEGEDTTPEDKVTAPESKDAAPEKKKVKPSKKSDNHTPVKRLQVLLVIFLTLVASVLSIMSNHKYLEGFAPFYAQLGIINTDNLKFTKFEVKKTPDGRNIRYIVTGEITNESTKDMHLPPLRLVALTKGGRTLGLEMIDPTLVFIPAGATIPYNKDMIVSGSSHTVTLDIGNRWELLFR